ncbi:MAG: bifunctional metallophosphatase/5'-nucleotidase [Candidatus Eremiobacteraeota bacterium]|nr:bifunctional metallophosphatase/5'-nucleotidase [Candidatus Eremiobacteraeota bacterium]MCW5869300.1 bifunctional metallophosphatase/5'-nucleotidase [Candidatus Eremiobacteraeota bacterium]
MEKVSIFAFNDFHRRLEPFADGSGGAARLVGKLRQLKAENPNSITVNVGDVAGDNSKLGPDSFAPIAELFDRAQVDVLALGNHEFEDSRNDYETLRNGLIKPFQGETLCANVSYAGQPIEGTKPFTVKQLAGFNIALLGVVTQDLSSKMHPTAGLGLSSLGIKEVLQKMVPQLDAANDAVVVLGHENLRKMTAFTEGQPGVDVALAAHDHRLTEAAVVVERPDGSQGFVSEAGAYGQSINQIDLYFDPATRQLVKVEMTNHKVDSSCPSDPVAEEIVRNAPALERAEKPKEVSRREQIRLNSFSDLSQWYTINQGSK